jgi:hypothetical protein
MAQVKVLETPCFIRIKNRKNLIAIIKALKKAGVEISANFTLDHHSHITSSKPIAIGIDPGPELKNLSGICYYNGSGLKVYEYDNYYDIVFM